MSIHLMQILLSHYYCGEILQNVPEVFLRANMEIGQNFWGILYLIRTFIAFPGPDKSPILDIGLGNLFWEFQLCEMM